MSSKSALVNSHTPINTGTKKASVVSDNKTLLNRHRKRRCKAKHKLMGRVSRTGKEIQNVCAINFSEKVISDDMALLLEKGPSFSPMPNYVNWKQFVLDFETFVNRLRRKKLFFKILCSRKKEMGGPLVISI